MKNNNTQEVLHTFFTKEVKDLSPVDYKHFISVAEKDEDSVYPSLPARTVIVAAGNNGQDAELLIVRTPDNTYYLVDENDEDLIEFSKTLDVDPKTDEMYPINHYDDNGTHYHFTSYTSYTGLILHNLTEETDYYMGSITPLTSEYVSKTKYSN
jgi:hypothetical protein